MAWHSQTPALARGVTIAAPQRKGGGAVRGPPPPAAPRPGSVRSTGPGGGYASQCPPGEPGGRWLGRGQKRPHHPTGGLFWPSTDRPKDKRASWRHCARRAQPPRLRGLALRRAAGEQPTFAPQGLRSIYARPWAACAPHRRPKGGRLRRRPRPPEQGAQRPKWWAGLPIGPQGPTPGGHARAGREGGPGGKGLPRSGKGPPVLR